jgi:cell wall-associated NlpC family hydrolase
VTDVPSLIAEARSWVGVPFIHQGRSRLGVDCIGLIIVALQRLGCLEQGFEITNYSRLPSNDQLMTRVQSYCVRLAEPVPGAMLAIKWNKDVSHVGIFTGENLIHAYQGRGRVIEHSLRGRWLRMIDSAWALPGVAYE